jgi:hypothetical protein
MSRRKIERFRLFPTLRPPLRTSLSGTPRSDTVDGLVEVNVHRLVSVIFALALSAAIASGQSSVSASSLIQRETDEYTRYELLAPETSSFAIHYEVTAITPGAKYYYNPIRKGSVARWTYSAGLLEWTTRLGRRSHQGKTPRTLIVA